MLRRLFLTCTLAFAQAMLWSQQPPPSPPAPPPIPLPPAPGRTNSQTPSAPAFLVPRLTTNIPAPSADTTPTVRPSPPATPAIPAGMRVLTPGGPPVYVPRSVPQSYPVTNSPTSLAWDASSKEFVAKPSDTNAHLVFSVTNVSPSDVTIYAVRTSCGCTIAKVPRLPWKLVPKEKGDIDVTVDLRGKFGVLHKMVSVETSAGVKLLSVQVTLPPSPNIRAAAPATAQINMELANRAQNISRALADRQAVFKNDCASCHAQPAAGKTGAALYQAACAICHNSPHRASMVPDLALANKPGTSDYWQNWIADGKEGTLMPAFAKKHGGPLTDDQVQSLVQYLGDYFSKKQASTLPGQVHSN